MSQGSIFSWGSGSTTALGHPTSSDKINPTMIEALRGKHLVDASCGAMHCIAVTGLGDTYSWGNNKYGQIGMNDSVSVCAVPALVPGLIGVVISAVCCGSGHSVACAQDGRVFSWGLGTQGQLGHGSNTNVFAPRAISALDTLRVAAVSCGMALFGCNRQPRRKTV